MDDAALPPELTPRYQARAVLGTGSFGRVFRAYDRELDREVAIKVLHSGLGAEEAARFDAEAEALGRICHPSVVRVYDHGRGPAGPWIVMEMLDGASLAKAPPSDPVRSMLQAAKGLQAIHDAGLLHRDVKPANILKTRDDRVVLLDLGLVLDPGRARLTRTGEVVGTLDYLAPELLAGPEGTPASDWYAWGASLYRLLEERPPFHPAVIMAAAQGVDLPEPSFQLTDPESPAAQAVIACLRAEPSERPCYLGDVRELLGRSRRSTAAARAVAPSDGPRRWLGPTLGLLGMLGLGVAGGLWMGQRPPAPAPAAPLRVSTSSPQRERGEALRAMREAMDRFAIAHRSPGGVYRATTGGLGGGGEHTPAVLREYVDGRIVGRYRRALETLQRWLEAAPRDSVHGELLENVVPFWLHMITDETMVLSALKTRRPALLDPQVDLEVVEARVEELGDLRGSYARLAADLPGVAGLLVRTVLGDLLVSVHDPLEMQTRLAIASTLEDPVDRLWGAYAAAAFLHFDLLGKGVPRCDERSRALDFLVEALDAAAEEAPRALVARTRATWLIGAIHQYSSCQKDASPAQADRISQELTALESMMEAHPADAAGPTRAYLEGLLVYLEAGGILLLQDQRPLLDSAKRIAPLVDRARAHQGLPPLPPKLIEGNGLIGALSDLR